MARTNTTNGYRRSGRSSYNGSRTRSYNYGYQYQYGSEARALYAAEEESTRRSAENQRRVARTRREQKVDLARTAMMFAAIFVICTALIGMVSLQSTVTRRVKQVASYQSQLASLKEANDETYNEILTSVDLGKIKLRAMNDLGMTYAAEDQILSYEGDTTDYVHQVQEVGR